MNRESPRWTKLLLLLGAVVAASCVASLAMAQTEPTMVSPSLGVRTVVSGLVTPITIAFLDTTDILVLEKNTGRVKRFKDGLSAGRVLDLGVNSFSERGLLGIALHPDFPNTPQVFLYWTIPSTAPPSDPFSPDERVGLDANIFGPDIGDVLQVPLLGNRVDRFTWDGTLLNFDKNLLNLRSFQNDAAAQPPGQGDQDQPPRGNHDGGVLAFGPDGKLYVYFGDQGRRGQLQNLPSGPTATGLGPVMADDQFGGPEPDDAHFSGVILRLETDGTAPTDNPFFELGAGIGGEVGANLQKVYAYGLRNSFGMAFDPESGLLWEADNGEDAYDEINRVDRGMNGGWIQTMGPISRVMDFRAIETTSLNNEDFPNLQQFRWPSENIAFTLAEARQRLFMLPGAVYRDPQLSFRYVLAPAALGFAHGSALGPEFEGRMFMGLATLNTDGGALLYMKLNEERNRIQVTDPRLRDRVVDNLTFYETTEAESLLAGRNFGIVTDIKTGPNGNLFVVSLSRGAIYEIFRKSDASALHTAATPTSPALRTMTPMQFGKASAIEYSLPERGRIDLAIFDLQGRRVATLAQGDRDSGRYTESWDGTNLSGHAVSSGIYFVRLEMTGASGTQTQDSGRLMVLR